MKEKDKIKKQIEELRKQILRHDYCYYVLNQPEISDTEYDKLMKKLGNLEESHPEFITSDSPTQRVGGEPVKGFKTVRHKAKMLSLDNTYSVEELKSWDKRVKKWLKGEKVEYVAELKIDGTGVSLSYRDGVFYLGVSRGDGERGEDISSNLRTIRSLALKLWPASDKKYPIPRVLEVRGEVYMNHQDFQGLNKQRKHNNEALFANPRNAAAGSLKLLDPRISARRGLNFFIHSFGNIEGGKGFDSQWEFLHAARQWALRISPNIKFCKDINEVISYCNKWQDKRSSLQYEIDGIVVKVNSIKQHKELGHTLKSPRWAVAYKFPSHQVTTRLNNIRVQVGRTGVITPVAELKPVECGGVTISKATLHNFDEIERLDVRVGDRVLLERAGEVIPKIIKVVKSVRTGKEKRFSPPRQCPVCDGPIEREKEGEVAFRCVNPSCPAQIERSLLHFASRSAMDIEGLGKSIVKQLIAGKLVSALDEIYALNKEGLLKLDLFAEKKAENLLISIEKSKSRSLGRLFFALGIRHVGEKAAQLLAEKYPSVDKLMEVKKEELQEIREIGPVMAESIEGFFNNKSTKKLIKNLRHLGLNMSQVSVKKKPQVLADKIFVFTGQLDSHGRGQAEALVGELGGRTSSAVSKKTDYLVRGSNPGSKYEKAKKLGIAILDENGFEELIRK
ncbi:MAG: NAD-dependent DNA ligase LigA [Candidatus Omnitrophota bacterium]|nr:NAD-dependent DNA ligase LigA [Candidatus Omnitrophota bacterium]